MNQTYRDLYQILIEAEQRVKNFTDPEIVKNSQETVELVNERMRRDGITRTGLAKFARH